MIDLPPNTTAALVGALVGLATPVVTALSPWAKRWLEKRIDAGVEHELKQRMANHQHLLDVQLGEHKERVRSEIDKSITDYAIYAQRRHDNIAKLFGALLDAEVRANQRAYFFVFRVPESEEELTARLTQLEVSSNDRKDALGLLRDGHTDELKEWLHKAGVRAHRRHVITARDDAHDAYFTAALYLPDDVDAAALAVRDKFNAFAEAAVFDGDGPSPFQLRKELRDLMTALQAVSRLNLRASAEGETRLLKPGPG